MSGGPAAVRATARSSGRSTSVTTPARPWSSPSPTSATRPCRARGCSSTTSWSPPARAAPPSSPATRRLDRLRARRRAARATTTTGSWAPPTTDRRRPVRSPPAPSPASPRSSASWAATSAATRSATPAASSTTSTGSASPWRTRPGRSTRGPSSPTPTGATTSSSTSWPTSGTATAWPCTGGRTSGSTRGSRRTPSGCGREHEGQGTAQEIFDFFYNDFIPDDHPWWQITIGDPGPDLLFEFPVYFRGAMTLHVLRLTVGDTAFFRILRRWARTRANGNVSTPQFIALAEQISGQQLDDLFQTWLYTPGKPPAPAGVSTSPRRRCRPPRRRPCRSPGWKRAATDRPCRYRGRLSPVTSARGRAGR